MNTHKTKKSDEITRKAKEFLPDGCHGNYLSGGLTSHPFTRASNSRLWDADGNEHLDLACRSGAMIVGHNNAQYNEAIIDQLQRVTAVPITGIEGEVAERIVAHVPGAEMVRFSLSGTEAVLKALRLARAYTEKSKFVRFIGHYHGNTDNILGGRPNSPEYPFPVEFDTDIRGTAGRAPGILKAESYLIPWNDAEALERVLQDFGDDIAAVLMEPVCVNGGGIMPHPGYLQKVRELCDRYGTVLIFDEIITGFRLSIGGAQEQYDVNPDITILGKAIAGGALPISVVASKRELMDLYVQHRVTDLGTFNGYALGLAAIKATLDILEDDSECYQRMEDVLASIRGCMLDAAASVELPLVFQELKNPLVFHAAEQPLKDPSEYLFDQKLLHRNFIINNLLAESGIHLSFITRLFGNITLNHSDITFFQERIFDVLSKAKDVMEQRCLI